MFLQRVVSEQGAALTRDKAVGALPSRGQLARGGACPRPGRRGDACPWPSYMSSAHIGVAYGHDAHPLARCRPRAAMPAARR
ncbi:hypothetical protein B296_00011571 [Ensete ventricosum]|uniref:Uncharacterized protein n=1 Tax=Ensete ventricosum TaxID=4639 RepID=A0A427ATU4_ENSVE|nr:hypothetical protein B296_00011571 [Ensete ventricosum]